jgi:hypothetical protein
MISDVDRMAGKVWETLGQKGEIGIAQLPRILKEQSAVVYQSLGWLARENKVQYKSKGGKIYVALTATEQHVYQHLAASKKREKVLV